MQNWVEEHLECIDAGLFSADTFHNEEEIRRLEFYMGRWMREIYEIRTRILDPYPETTSSKTQCNKGE